jgi:hypothetical protein
MDAEPLVAVTLSCPECGLRVGANQERLACHFCEADLTALYHAKVAELERRVRVMLERKSIPRPPAA